MGKTINVELSVSGLKDAIRQLEDYKRDLHIKCRHLVERLTAVGVIVAEQNVGSYGKYITFQMKAGEDDKSGCTEYMIATQTGIIRSEWQTKDGIKTADVSPLLMVEFGSGPRANNPLNVEGVGQGTFPGQTHAFDPGGWWYKDLEGTWHHSKGVTPKSPMYKASMAMHEQIITIAKDIFGA